MNDFFNKIYQPIKNALDNIFNKISESKPVQSIKQRFDELDPKKQTLVIILSISTISLIIVGGIGYGYYNLYTMKETYNSNLEIIANLDSISKEMQDVRNKIDRLGSGFSGKSATQVLSGLVTTSLISPDNVKVSNENPGSHGTEQLSENLIDVNLTKVSIKQVIRYCVQIENTKKGFVVKEINIDTNNDPTGYMNARIQIAFYKPQGGINE